MNDAHCIDTNFSLSLPLLLMSNASSIDLLVDLKKIQSQMPQVAFFPLWEIKRFNSPCLFTLIITISPSSPVVRMLRCFPFPKKPAPLTVSLYTPLPPSLLTPLASFQALFRTWFCLSRSDVRRAEESSRADNYQQETRVLLGRNEAGGHSLI